MSVLSLNRISKTESVKGSAYHRVRRLLRMLKEAYQKSRPMTASGAIRLHDYDLRHRNLSDISRKSLPTDPRSLFDVGNSPISSLSSLHTNAYDQANW